jgi:ABC-2 type transport system ATP-binding protein
MDNTTQPVIEVRGITKVYEPSPVWLRFLVRTSVVSPVRALDDVSLEVGAGEIWAVIGPNGAGKSTLFRILTGLTTATSGSASIMGLDVERHSRDVRRLVGFMPANDHTIYLRHSCVENLVFHGRLQGMAERSLRGRVDEVLELVDLTQARDRVGFALSAGMRARLQLARAMLHRPHVLILDEPTGAVDPVGSYQLLEVIQRVALEERVPVLLSSHRLEEIEALHDRIALFDRGRLIHRGSVAALRRTWQLPTIELHFDREEVAVWAADLFEHRDGVEVLSAGSRHVLVSTALPTGQVLEAIGAWLPSVVSVRESTMPLRELLARMLSTKQGPGLGART